MQKIFIAFIFVGVVACTGYHQSTDMSGSIDSCLSWDSRCVTEVGERELAIIDFKDGFNQKDTFDAHQLINGNYHSGLLKIKFKTDAEIIKAEKMTHYYPTMWAGMNDNAIQFIYLYDIEYTDMLSLPVNDGIIEYDAYGKGSVSAIKGFFDKVTKKQVLASIENVPEEYEYKSTSTSFKVESWKKRLKYGRELHNDIHPAILLIVRMNLSM